MATSQTTIDHLLDQLAAAGRVTARKMFGEYCLYLSDKPVALVCDNTLFVKPTTAGRELMPNVPGGSPYPGAKPHLKLLPDDWDDRDRLCELLRITFAELPPAPAKRPRLSSKSTTPTPRASTKKTSIKKTPSTKTPKKRSPKK